MSIIDDLRNARISPGDEGAQEQLIYLHHGILENLANQVAAAGGTSIAVFDFSPGNATPPTGVYTSWSALNTAMEEYPNIPKVVYVDGSNVSYGIDVPAGTYNFDGITFVGDDSTLIFKAGCVISSYYNVTFENLYLTTDATTGAAPFYTNASYSQMITLNHSGAFTTTGASVPLFESASALGIELNLMTDSYLIGEVGSAPVVTATGGKLYIQVYDNSGVEAYSLASSNAGSTLKLRFIHNSIQQIISTYSTFLDSHALWTNGTITIERPYSSTRAVSGTSSTLKAKDKILYINASGPHTTTLPNVAYCVGESYLIQRTDVNAVSLTLALDAGDTGARIYFKNNAPAAGANVTLTGSDSGLRPAFSLRSDGTNWWVS